MSNTVVALDCMGGDYAPLEPVKGAIDAIKENENIFVKLYGRKEEIEAVLSECADIDKISSSYEIVDCSEVIETGEPPVNAIRQKEDSSLVKCFKAVKNNEAHAMVSAGSTGANLVGGQVIIGRIKGVQRPPLAPLLPTENGVILLLDCGANVDPKAKHLVQFAKMGSVYMENVVGIKNPKVGLVNIGTEEEKGNALSKEAYQLLSQTEGINFVGNIEAREIPEGTVDVAVCDAFTGNMILKTYEGVGAVLLKKIKGALFTNLKTKIGALLIKKSLKNTMKAFNIEQYGGAPLLGLNGLLVKTHGNSKSVEVKNSIIQCHNFIEKDVNNKFKEKLSLK